MSDRTLEKLNALKYDEKWVAFFKYYPNAVNLLKIVKYIFPIPHSNAISERIFSLMNIAWRKDRNKLSLATLEAELMVKENFKMTCKEFRQYLNTSSAGDILKQAKSNQKYQV